MSAEILQYAVVKPTDIVRWYSAAEHEQPEFLDEVCLAVTAAIEGDSDLGIGHNVLSRAYSDEVHDGTGTCYLCVNHPPLTTLTAVKLRDVAQTVGDFDVVNENTGRIFFSGGFEARPLWGRPMDSGLSGIPRPDWQVSEWQGSADTSGIWKISYTGGWAAASVPWEIKQVAREMAIMMIRERSMLGTAARSVDGFAEQRWALGDQGTMARWKKLLSGYRLMRVV